MTVAETLQRTGPRKLLALDGGGIRGLISIEVLAEMERVLQDEQGADDDFVLSDYFDYVAGTSTGAIIATCIALGMRVDKIRAFYTDHGHEMFDKNSLLKRWKSTYADKQLGAMLRDVIGEHTTLGSDDLRILLMVVMRNATTDSPWPVSNNPAAMFNQAGPTDNLKLPLWQLVRASTAAPTFFPPEVIDVGAADPFVFVDGGVTMYNNPAFHLFLMATIQAYRLQWPTGQDEMLLVSVGTGASAKANKDLTPDEMNLIYNAKSAPSALMFGALNEQDFLCRVFGDCRHGDPLDREVKDMIGSAGPVSPKLFSYMRYNAELSEDWLAAHGLPDISAPQVQKMDSTDHMDDLGRVGRALATSVAPEHFRGFVRRPGAGAPD